MWETDWLRLTTTLVQVDHKLRQVYLEYSVTENPTTREGQKRLILQILPNNSSYRSIGASVSRSRRDDRLVVKGSLQD